MQGVSGGDTGAAVNWVPRYRCYAVWGRKGEEDGNRKEKSSTKKRCGGLRDSSASHSRLDFSQGCLLPWVLQVIYAGEQEDRRVPFREGPAVVTWTALAAVERGMSREGSGRARLHYVQGCRGDAPQSLDRRLHAPWGGSSTVIFVSPFPQQRELRLIAKK